MTLKKDKTAESILAAGLLKSLPDEYLLVMGQVISQWSILETIIEALCWQAGKIRNDTGRIFTSQMQMQSKLDLLEALLVQRNTRLASRFKRISSYIRNCLLGPRNLVIHGHWAVIPNASLAAVVKYSARGKLVSQSKMYTPSELKKLAGDIADVSAWMLKLWQKLPALKLKAGGISDDNLENLIPVDHTSQKTAALVPLSHPFKRQKIKKKTKNLKKFLNKIK